MKTVSVANDFSRYPGGRFRKNGPFSGEEFREDVLIPALRGSDEMIKIDFDGAMGYAPAFLDESFGGAVRLRVVTKEDLHRRLELVIKSRPSVVKEAWGYIDNATPGKMLDCS